MTHNVIYQKLQLKGNFFFTDQTITYIIFKTAITVFLNKVQEINLHSTVEDILNDNVTKFFWSFYDSDIKVTDKNVLTFTYHLILIFH